MILGLTTDPTFGPVLMFGMGGVHAETFRDVAFRIPPLTEVEAREMVHAIRSSSIVETAMGGGPNPLGGVVEALQRLSQLVQEHPEIAEIDLNPFQASPEGVVVLDVRISVGPVLRDASRHTP